MNAKSFFYGVLASLVIFFGAERAFHTFVWSGQVNLEAKAGAASFKYLTESIGNGADGKPITRAQVLDAFIAKAKRASEQQTQYSRPSAPDGKN
jgi:hypothetical protein